MKTIWSGFDTTPHTLPDKCVICSGHEGGDFVTLPCGHGAPLTDVGEYETPYMHVKCLVKSYNPSYLERFLHPGKQQHFQCPTCRKPADSATLSSIARYLRNGNTVTFPGENDQEEKGQMYTSLEEALAIFEKLVIAQKELEHDTNIDPEQKEETKITPVEEEQDPAYWDGILQDCERTAQTIEGKLAGGYGTQDEIKKDQSALEARTGRAIAAAGRLVYFLVHQENSIFSFTRLSYMDIYDRFAKMSRRLEYVNDGLQREENVLTSWEEKKAPSHKIWNGFDTTPPTTPEACSLCHGEGTGGNFIILDCGHGTPENTPLHVSCTLDRIKNASDNGQPVCCPKCYETIKMDTLSRLANFVYRNEEISYPANDGSTQKLKLYETDHEMDATVHSLVKARRREQGSQGFLRLSDRQARDHFRRILVNMSSSTQEVEKKIKDRAYTLEEADRDLLRLEQTREFTDVLAGQVAQQCVDFDGRRVAPTMEAYRLFSGVEDSITKTIRLLRQYKRCLKAEEGHGADLHKRVWSGFTSDPETQPRDCLICLGEQGGDFITLDCGHGGAENNPLHVKCVINMTITTTQDGNEPHCPTCDVPISAGVMSDLNDCIRRNDYTLYPDDDGKTQYTRVCDSDEKAQDLLNTFENIQKTRSEEKKASAAQHDGSRVDDYDHFVTQMEELAGDVERGLEERSYTTEELADKQREMDDLNRRVTAFAERTRSQAERSTPLQEKYEHLLDVREHLRTVEGRLRQEKEAMQHHEEESERMHHPA